MYMPKCDFIVKRSQKDLLGPRVKEIKKREPDDDTLSAIYLELRHPFRTWGYFNEILKFLQ